MRKIEQKSNKTMLQKDNLSFLSRLNTRALIALLFCKNISVFSFSDYKLTKTFEARGAPFQKRYKCDCIRAGGARNFSLSVSREAKLGHIDKAERQNTFLSAKKWGG